MVKKKTKKNKSAVVPPPHSLRIDYNQPQSCPYIPTSIVRVIIESMECHIPETYIKKYNQLNRRISLFPPTIKLDDINGDIGHTVVHFLYTGQYETLSSAPDENTSPLDLEYRRSVQTYHAARTYDLHGLVNLAIKYIRRLGESMSVFKILQVAQTVFSKLPEDETWFRGYLQQNLQDALMLDKDLFKKDELHAALGGDPILYAAVMKMMVDIYNIRLMYERLVGSNSAAKVLADDEKEAEKEAEEVPLEAQTVGEHLTDEACPPEECPSDDVVRNRSEQQREEEPPEESSINANTHSFGYSQKPSSYSEVPTFQYKIQP